MFQSKPVWHVSNVSMFCQDLKISWDFPFFHSERKGIYRVERHITAFFCCCFFPVRSTWRRRFGRFSAEACSSSPCWMLMANWRGNVIPTWRAIPIQLLGAKRGGTTGERPSPPARKPGLPKRKLMIFPTKPSIFLRFYTYISFREGI